MVAKLVRNTSNDNFSQPSWYTSLVVDLIDLKVGSAIKTLAKGLDGKHQDTAKELATMMVTAFNQCEASAGFQAKLEAEYPALFVEHPLDVEFPGHHPLFQHLFNQLKQQRFAADPLDNEDWISPFRSDFATEFNELVRLGGADYPAAEKYIQQLRLKPPAESQLIRLTNQRLDEINSVPLAIDSQLTLHQSYVSPSCEIQQVTVPNKQQDKKPQPQDCLLATLVNQLEQHQPWPIIIHGQPGHGKTSCVKMLYRTLVGLYQAVAEPPQVLLFEFKHLGQLNRRMIDVITEQVDFIQSADFFVGKKTILIFDGLDERQLTDGSGDQNLRYFVENCFKLAADLNAKENSRLNLILTGRSQYVGQIQSCFNQNHVIVDIQNFDQSQQQVWLDKFNQQKYLSAEQALSLDSLNHYKLDELLDQPILLAISAIMLADPQGQALIAKQQGRSINRAMIYYTIIEWSYQKRWHHSPGSESWKKKLRFEDYFILLQAIAFEIVCSGKETIRLSKLAERLKDNSSKVFAIDAVQNISVAELEQLCSQLRISFFFKGVEDNAFAFIHKSFKDFLLASGMVDATPSILDNFNSSKPQWTDEDIVALYGQVALSHEDHMEFLHQWLQIKQDDIKAIPGAIRYGQPKAPMAKLADQAMLLWQRIARQELELTAGPSGEQIRMAATVSFNYLQLLSRWLVMLPLEHRKALFECDGWVQLFDHQWFNRLQGLWLSQGLVHKYFDWQYLFGINLSGRFEGCSFRHAWLKHGAFIDASLVDCDFTKAQFDVISISSDYRRCQFVGMPLFEVYERSSRKQPSRFIDCKLTGSKVKLFSGRENFQFIDCDLSEVEFFKGTKEHITIENSQRGHMDKPDGA